MGRSTANPATDPAVQAALVELRDALAPFTKVLEAYGRSRPAPGHVVLRVHGPKGARAEITFGDFERLGALVQPPASVRAEPETADADAGDELAEDVGT